MNLLSSSSSSTEATIWLILWMMNNILVTLLNKAAFVSIDFQYPYLLSAIHMVTNGLGAHLIFWSVGSSVSSSSSSSSSMNCTNTNHNNNSANKPSSSSSYIYKILGPIPRKLILSSREYFIYFIYSIIFSLNIAIGNLSLSYVSVNFNQVMRSLVPAITIVLSYGMGQYTSLKRILAVIPIVIGVAMATYGDFTFTWMGFIITMICVFLAALKVVASGYLLQGNQIQLHPVDLLYKMTPFATIQCFFLSIVSGEYFSFHQQYILMETPTTTSHVIHNHSKEQVSFMYMAFFVLGSGILAFSLNISSLMANKLTSPLTLCIAANVKQVLMMVSSTIIFETPVSLMNGLGIGIVLIGSAIYSFVSLQEDEQSRGNKKKKKEEEEGEKNNHIQLQATTTTTTTMDKMYKEKETMEDEDEEKNIHSSSGISTITDKDTVIMTRPLLHDHRRISLGLKHG